MNFVNIPPVQRNLRLIILPLLFFAAAPHGGFAATTVQDIETAVLEQDFTRARELAEQFIQDHPQDPQLNEVRYHLGIGLLYLGKYDEARQIFTELAARQPAAGRLSDQAALGVVDSYYLAGDYASALREAEGFLKSRPDSEFLSLAYLKLARANLKLMNWRQARRYLNKVTRRFPDTPESHTARQLLKERQFFAVQVGSFINRAKADALLAEMKERGEYAYLVETEDAQGRKFYRVRIGKLSTLTEAQDLEAKLSSYGYPTRIYP